LFSLCTFLKITNEAKILGNFFPRDKLCMINFDKKINVWLHFRRFFHKLIWSPWLRSPRNWLAINWSPLDVKALKSWSFDIESKTGYWISGGIPKKRIPSFY
jgi:hypothetical protein